MVSLYDNDTTFTSKQRRVIENLIDIAQKSDMQSLHGAAIIRNGKVLAYGYNSKRIYINGTYVSSTHAEIHVLAQALKGTKPSPRKLCHCEC